jgi:hypothetical protein
MENEDKHEQEPREDKQLVLIGSQQFYRIKWSVKSQGHTNHALG